MNSAVIVFPGSNCDRDLATAFRDVTGKAPAMVWHRETALPDGIDVIGVPGGFSYGDYLRCGAIAARSPVMRAVKRQADKGVMVIGVCNGFQIMCESGLLPGVLRAELACPEEVLYASDLPATRLWVGNALRGLIPAVWAGGSA